MLIVAISVVPVVDIAAIHSEVHLRPPGGCSAGGDLDELVVPVGPSKASAVPADSDWKASSETASAAEPVTARRRVEPPSQFPTIRRLGMRT